MNGSLKISAPVKADQTKIATAIRTLRNSMPLLSGMFRALISERNANEVEFFCDDGLYCTVNVHSGKIKGK